MKNLVSDGRTISDVIVPYVTTSGQGVKFGVSGFGVAMMDIGNGQPGTLLCEGVVDIAKEPALAVAAGDRVFWDDANRRVNKTAAAQLNVGTATVAAAGADATVRIRLGATTPAGT